MRVRRGRDCAQRHEVQAANLHGYKHRYRPFATLDYAPAGTYRDSVTAGAAAKRPRRAPVNALRLVVPQTFTRDMHGDIS